MLTDAQDYVLDLLDVLTIIWTFNTGYFDLAVIVLFILYCNTKWLYACRPVIYG